MKKPAADPTADLADFIGGFYFDPLGFVLGAFDWGHGDLAGEEGPDVWQADALRTLGEELRRAHREGGAIRLAVKSGHGIGKTTLIAWVSWFFMSVQPDVQVILTANTKTQLETKTWRELAKWRRRLINADWFVQVGTKAYHKERPDTWFISAIPWSEENPEAFAGAGDAQSRTVFLFDEASAIADVIHETSEGALTRTGATKIAFGNPTRNTGWFRECWRKFEQRWRTFTVDSRQAKKADAKTIREWIEDYGLDSDFVKVRVLGEFPRQSSSQFISSDMVMDAMTRRLDDAAYMNTPKLLGVDVARFGDDETVICRRQGGKVWPMMAYRGLDTQEVGRLVAREIRDWQPHAVYIDGIGIGAGVVDYLKHTGHDVIDVVSSRKPLDEKLYRNLRVEMWGELRAALPTMQLPHDDRLFSDLTSPEYFFNDAGQLILEKKEDMQKRGLGSPDRADALALTYAGPADVSGYYEAMDAANDDDWTPMEGRSSVTGY